ncbi:ketopantoate reductase family protein [Chitinophaga sp. RCC_12]|uniref:ketopantoate reductase family protein n=1 Tax=Chitinophaga sp. RCC_12 TaxID=3239226 RepID=UPI0035247A5D
MNNKYRIAIIGIGGVGGFIGGKLAARYRNSDNVEVIFVARGNHLKAIRENGLKVIIAETEMIVHPDLATDDPLQIGPVDLVLCCTKTYHLEESVRAMANNITSNTIVLPLFNGVDNAEKIKKIIPQAKVLDGCIYLASKLLSSGVVKQAGNFYALHFGGSILPPEQSSFLDTLFSDADIHAVNESDILKRVWTKFAFVSPLATYTSANNICFGEILESPVHSAALKQLMSEVIMLAVSKGIPLEAVSIDANFEMMAKLPFETTSSLHNDFSNGRQTEVETLTGYVVREAKNHNLQLNNYEAFYQQLSSR